MIVYLLTAGFVSMLGQVVILRELNVAFYGIELIYILAIGFWLIGTAIGASIGRHNTLPNERGIRGLFFLLAILLLTDIVFIRAMRNLFGGVPGGFLPFFWQLLGLAVSLLPVSILSGLLFQWTAKKFIDSNETLAKAYAIESAGGILGGLTSTLFLYFGLQNFAIALICCLCSLGVITYYSRRDEYDWQKYLFIPFFMLFFILLAASPYLDRQMTSWNHPYVIESKDTPYSRVTVTAQENQISVFEDGALTYETENVSSEELVHMSMLHSQRPDDVLVLGNGFGGILLELLKLPVKKIDYVEINRDLIETLQAHLPGDLRNSLADERVRIIYDDPRSYLETLSSYDVIIAGMPDPASAQSNRFYTAEFFKSCSRHLKSEGIFVFQIRSAENLWTDQLQIRNKSIYNALQYAFTDVVVLPGATNIFIASNSHLSTDPSILVSRFNERKPETKLVSPEYIRYVYTNDRFADIKARLSFRMPVINSDRKPACYNYTTSIWLSKFFPGLSWSETYFSGLTDHLNSLVFWVVVFLVSGFITISERMARIRRFMLVFLAGFIGMILETVLVLNYQSKSGVLYRDIGILLMSFMAGLTIGSYVINRILGYRELSLKVYLFFGIILLVGFAAFDIGVYYTMESGVINSLGPTSAALMFDGFFVSAIFAIASFHTLGGSQTKMIRLYSADLIGGCVGSIAASLILVPVYGILSTSMLMAIVAACTLIFLR